MANHKSSIKRIRSNEAKRQRNRYQAKTVRTLVKEIRTNDKKAEVTKELPKVLGAIDKLAKKNVLHKNKAANLKSKLMRKANKLTAKAK